MKKEIRPLLRDELERLIKEAPIEETKFLKESGRDPYEFFNNQSEIVNGLIIDGRPIYIAAVMLNKDQKHVFWTVVNSDVQEVITLSISVRKQLKIWLEQFGTIYATMGKTNKDNMKWVEWLGFKKIEEDIDTVTYKIGA